MRLPQTKYARSGTFRIAYQALGQASVDLVLVPGLLSNIDIHWEDPDFAAMLRRLSAFSRLIQFDPRGRGLSDRVEPAELPDLEAEMADLGAVLDAAGVGRAALFAMAEGVPLALHFAAAFPERMRALILYGGCADARDAIGGPEAVERFCDAAEARWGTGASLGLFAPGRADDAHFAAWWARLERFSAGPSVAVALARRTARTDVRGLAGRVRVPVLVLHRRDDVRVRVEAGRALARAIPQARFVELAGRDHPAWAGDSLAVTGAIEEFLTGSHLHRPAPKALCALYALRLTAEVRGGAAAEAAEAERRAQFFDALATRVRHAGGTLLLAGPARASARFDGPTAAAQLAGEARALAVEMHLGAAHGLHAGEFPLGAEWSGPAVDAAFAIAERAGAEEILASGLFADLSAGSGLLFAERGGLALGGYPRPLAILELRPEQHLEPQARRRPAGDIDGLSQREAEVLALVADGLSNREIAAALSLSGHTVKRHVANILTKLDLPSRTAAASIYARQPAG